MQILKNKNYLNLFYSFSFFLIAFIFYHFQTENFQTPNIQDKLQKEIIKKENLSDNIFNKINQLFIKENSWNNIQKIIPVDLYKKEGLIFLIYDKSEKLKFWSDNAVPVSSINIKQNNTVIKLENGWYHLLKKDCMGQTIISLALIKREFAYQNDYLVNEFFKGYDVPLEIEIIFNKNQYPIYSYKGDYLFSIQKSATLHISERYIYIILILCIIAFLFFCSFLFDLINRIGFLNNFPFLTFILFLSIVILLRIILFYFEIPEFLYNSKLFSPYYYAVTSYLPSLGDLLINACIFLFLSYVFFTKVKTETLLKGAKKQYKLFLSVLLMFTIIILFYFYVILCKSIVIDSSIQMLMSDIFKLTFESLVGSFIIFSLSVSFILISTKLFYVSKYLSYTFKYHIITLLLSIGLFILFHFPVFWKEGFFYPFFFLVYFALLFAFDFLKKKISIFQRIVVLTLFFSFFSTFTFYKYNDSKELDKRKLLVQKMSAENDPIAEYLFKDILPKIKHDSLINRHIRMFSPENQIVDYIKSEYFKGYLSKYTSQITICKDFQSLILKPTNYKINCDKYFYDKITLNGFSTPIENFYSLDYGSGSNSYIAVIRFMDDISDSLLRTSVYIEMEAKFISKDLGYPELLIDKKLNLIHDLSDYSYAKYVNKQLVRRFGICYYENKLKQKNKLETFYVYDRDGFNHLLYNVNKKTNIVISKQKINILERLAPFSNFFIVFSIFFILIGITTSYFRNIMPVVYNFKTKLQIAIISIMLVSFIIIGATTLIYITKLNNDKNTELLTEKTHSVLVELEHKLGDEKQLLPIMSNQINDLLVKFSNVFFTDINLYSKDGKLIASSRMQIFDEGLISDQMNANAFYELKNLEKSQYLDNENIGNHEYLSSYMPFRNNDNKLIAFINLPYFAKQGDLKKEISSFLKAYLNIYLFLIIIAVIIALFVSNYITRPLKFIIDNIGKIKLGKKNEKIQWKRNDEIGNLIEEYNSMIDQLAISAEKLGKSEREVAWREMAKQVAHEIKNPLTPMKLSIQHLQRAWNDKVPDWDDRLKRLTNTIIEQIDSLSAIASEFSDFAKMPKSDFEKVNISTTLINSIDLYRSSIENKVIFNTDIDENCYVFADKKQMVRVFNNLIKNALQAIYEKKDGEINISLTTEKESVFIKIKDNGVGIEESQKEKVFAPYFTTKSGGSGLGLAMVKSILDVSDGKIWFESLKGYGTTFFIQLKRFGN